MFTSVLQVSASTDTIEQVTVFFQQNTISDQYSGNMLTASGILTVDGTLYNASQLPISFNWDVNSTHIFSWHSPLIVCPCTRYVWISTSGLSTSMNDTITIQSGGSVNATYKAQHHVTIQAGSSGTVSPNGTAWYYEGSLPISAMSSTGFQFMNWSAPAVNFTVTDLTSNSTILTIKGSGTVKANFLDIAPPVIANLSPVIGGILTTSGVTINASYSDNVALDPSSVVLKVDGRIVTQGATITTTGIIYSTSLPIGIHNVELAVKDLSENVQTVIWSFTVIPWEYVVAVIVALVAIVALIILLTRTRKPVATKPSTPS